MEWAAPCAVAPRSGQERLRSAGARARGDGAERAGEQD